MAAKAVRVRRVPVGVSSAVCHELDARTNLPGILFANKKDKEKRWEVVDHINRKTGEKDPNFRDIKMGFAPSKGLKDLSKALCDHEPDHRFEDRCFCH